MQAGPAGRPHESRNGEAHHDPDHGRRQLSGPQLVAHVQQPREPPRCDVLNALEADHVVLEMARRPEAELEMLREVKAQLKLGIGVIDIKDNEVETPDQVARQIERAARCLGLVRIAFVHPDCGLWMLPRSVADAKLRALVAGRDLFGHGGAA
jgi:methionine synthase II (cobalamin-independent)